MNRAALAAVPALALTAGCATASSGAAGSDADSPRVVAAFYPFAFAAERVAGDAADVVNLTRPGVEPHDLELTAREVGTLAEADVVVYEAGVQPAVDEAVEQQAPGQVVEVTEVVPLIDTGLDDAAFDEDPAAEADGPRPGSPQGPGSSRDPHVWLDPVRLATVAEAIAERLGEVDPAEAAGYRQRAAALRTELEALDAEMRAGLADCERRVFVSSHAAFGYLALRYDLEMVPVSGLAPDAEPTPARLAEVQEVVEREGVTTVFYERLVSPKVAQTLADDLGVRTAVLDPVEGLTDETADEDYLSLMRDNLEALRTANGCR